MGWRAGWLGLWGSGAVGLCWALLGLWAGLGAGLGSSGFETEIGLLENGEVVSCAVGLGWARSSGFETEIGLLENGEVVSRPEKKVSRWPRGGGAGWLGAKPGWDEQAGLGWGWALGRGGLVTAGWAGAGRPKRFDRKFSFWTRILNLGMGGGA